MHEALARGAGKVSATARDPRVWSDDRIAPLTLDVTDPASIRAVAEAADDVTVLINNAGVCSASKAALWSATNSLRLELATAG